MPQKCIHGVGPSSFMDCRNLTKVDMTNTISSIDSRKNETNFLANNPFVIGDHAFASCVKLKGFTFPTNLTEIGESAFHNCSQIFGFFLPANNSVNTISIGKYAFADCSNLVVIHMEKNINFIDSYAFAQCNKLKIYYQGDPSVNGDPMQSFDTYFRKKHVATNKTDAYADYVPMDTGVSEMSMDDDHPGLIYVKQPGPIKYNGKTNSTLDIDSNTDEFVTIFQWNTPSVESDDYDAVNDILTIPDTIAGVPVKRISEQAFYRSLSDNVPLKGIVFNPSLVQICKEAFKGCNQLSTIDFSNCVTLREIGPHAFNPSPTGNNTAFTGTLSLPNSLYYIGTEAFVNFRKATGLELFNSQVTPYLKTIGAKAFQNFGYNVTASHYGTLDLLLPYSLNVCFSSLPMRHIFMRISRGEMSLLSMTGSKRQITRSGPIFSARIG